MTEEPITKEEVRDQPPVVIPNFPPFFVMVIFTITWLITHPRQLARMVINLVFGAVAFGVVIGFVLHMGVDAFNWAWDLWAKI